jgi:membrane protease YdiL (CAAX protease family)
MIGLVSAACILTAFWVVARAQFKIAKPADRMEIDDLLPRTSTELAAFIAFTLVAGCSWELLFRGYLMWALPPHLGLVGSVVVAATAYGVAHGYTNIRAFAASLASALLFTIAFAATKSLWWLMVVHCGLPLIAAMMAQAQRPALPAPTEP